MIALSGSCSHLTWLLDRNDRDHVHAVIDLFEAGLVSYVTASLSGQVGCYQQMMCDVPEIGFGAAAYRYRCALSAL